MAGLEAQNAARQKAEQDYLQGVLDSVAADETYGATVSLSWGRGYHQGVIGIVASRVVGALASRPSSYPLTRTARQGSGRSIAGVSLYNAYRRLRRPAHPVRRTRAGQAVCAEENLPAFRRRSTRGAQEHRCSSARRCGWTRRCPA